LKLVVDVFAKVSKYFKVRQFLEHVIPGILRPALTAWNQIIGFLFIVLAIWAAVYGIRVLREFKGDPPSILRLLFTIIFVVMMAGFGISSFLRARKISRS
jgi:hypothetical protein